MELSSAACQQHSVTTRNESSSTLRILESVVGCPEHLSCARRKHEAGIVIPPASPSQRVSTADTETGHLFVTLTV